MKKVRVIYQPQVQALVATRGHVLNLRPILGLQAIAEMFDVLVPVFDAFAALNRILSASCCLSQVRRDG